MPEWPFGLGLPLPWWYQNVSRQSQRWPSSQLSSSTECAACHCSPSPTSVAHGAGDGDRGRRECRGREREREKRSSASYHHGSSTWSTILLCSVLKMLHVYKGGMKQQECFIHALSFPFLWEIIILLSWMLGPVKSTESPLCWESSLLLELAIILTQRISVR